MACNRKLEDSIVICFLGCTNHQQPPFFRHCPLTKTNTDRQRHCPLTIDKDGTTISVRLIFHGQKQAYYGYV